ncbi:retrovirus-related pol polyprotein from transposon TNT 1-94 [Tanacetum coccineum]
MSGTLPPPPVTSSRNAGNPNRVEDAFQTHNTNNTGTNNVALNVVNEDLPQLLDSRRGSHVTNVPAFDMDDFTTTLYGKYNYEEELIDQIYESETKRFTIQSSTSKALISNTHFQDSDSDAEIDTRSSSEFLVDLNAQFYDRALFANHKRFYKRSGKVGSARKPMDKSNETCFACGKQRHFQKYCPTTKTSSPSYPSSNKNYNKTKFHTISSSSQQYRGKYKALKAKLALLTKKIDDVSKNMSEKGLVAESFDWDEESLSYEDEGVTTVKAFIIITKDEPTKGKADARSSQWVEINMKKLHRLMSMNDGDERKHVLDYTNVDLDMCNGYSKMDKNKAKKDKTKHGIERA